MSSWLAPPLRRPPRLYRLARLFGRLSVVVLVVLAVFLATALYSAAELVRASPQAGGYSAGFAPNDTVSISGKLSLSNPGLYPVSGFTLSLRVLNQSSVFLGAVAAGPVGLAPRSTTAFPIALYLPIVSDGPAESLLVQDQVLEVGVWGNATYAYLFPISVHFVQNQSWGAPFAGFRASASAPSGANGSVVGPLTISFTNHASFPESGSLDLVLRSPGGASCGTTAFALNVAPGAFYYQTRSVAIATGCSVAGGSVDPTFVGGGATIPLPPEALP